METKVFRTNLKCQNCVLKAAVFLGSDQGIAEWSVQTNDERKLLSVTGTQVNADHIRSLVKKAGFNIFEEIHQRVLDPGGPAIQDSPPAQKAYLPLMLILLYLIGFVTLPQLKAGRWEWTSMMNAFMGGFFVVFSFFKLLNIRGFADAYGSYDIIARRFHAYGFIYPFIELALGICYFTAFAPIATNIATCAVMSLSTVGVFRSLLKKTKIQCACLGTVFNLPMSTVTLVEDLFMVGMSATMIGAMLWS
jgi:hypothetical protein